MKVLKIRLLAVLMCVLLLFVAMSTAIADDVGTALDGVAQDVTTKLKGRISEGKASNLTDRKGTTGWAPKKDGASLSLTVPADISVATLVIEWAKEPTAYSVTEEDASGNTLSTRDQADGNKGLQTCFSLKPNASRILLELPKKGEMIAEIYVFSEGTLPSSIRIWEAPFDKADLMVIAAHMGDEFLYMGGTIPYYRDVLNYNVQVVYVVDDGQNSQDEALNAVWTTGGRAYPTFLKFPNKASMSLSETMNNWGGEAKPVGLLVEQIRKYRPDVIVSNSPKGEKGDGARMAVASCVEKAVVAAADETQYPESVNAYGVWETKKLYLHQAEQNPITMNWQTSNNQIGGQTPFELAKVGYDSYKALNAFNPMVEGGDYDNSQFGLVYTTVGNDMVGNDFFENLSAAGNFDNAPNNNMDADDPDVNWADDDPGANLNDDDLLAAQGVLTPPSPTPTPVPDPTPTPVPTPVPSGFQIRENLEPLKTFGIILGAAIVLIALLCALRFVLMKQGYTFNPGGSSGKKKKKKSAAKKGASNAKAGATKKSAATGAKKSAAVKKPSASAKPDKETPPDDEIF